MKTLKALKVTIGLNKKGQCDYPNFKGLQVVKDAGLDWSKYVDVHGDGWHYDKVCGHKENDETSPEGTWIGVLLVPVEFADQAVAAFPNQCEKLTVAKYKAFHEDRAHIHEPGEKINQKVLEAIRVKNEMNIPLTPEQVKAVDPEDDTPGITKNKRKKLADYESMRGIKVN